MRPYFELIVYFCFFFMWMIFCMKTWDRYVLSKRMCGPYLPLNIVCQIGFALICYFGLVTVGLQETNIVLFLSVIFAIANLLAWPSMSKNKGLKSVTMTIVVICCIGILFFLIAEEKKLEDGRAEDFKPYIYFQKKFSRMDKGDITRHLGEKIRRLSELRSKLEEKETEIKSAYYAYKLELEGTQKEINDERNSKGVSTYKDASSNPVIHYGIISIQRKSAYMRKLEEIFSQVDSALLETKALEQKGNDDLRMASVLGDERVFSLMSQIAEFLEDKNALSEKLIIDESQLALKTPEQIWNEVTKN
jgi:hypothetical protein